MRFGAMVQPNIGDPDLPREIERLGFDSLWIPDSHMIASDCYAVMALAAMSTSRIRIGTGVSIAGTRIAPVTAHSIATINRIAPGRVFLGLGTGHTAMRTMGYDPVPPREFREYVRVTCELLRTGESDFTWRGKTRHVRFMHRQLGLIDLETPIPVLIAANGPEALEDRRRVRRRPGLGRQRAGRAHARKPGGDSRGSARGWPYAPRRLPRRHPRLRLRDAARRDAPLRAGDRAGRPDVGGVPPLLVRVVQEERHRRADPGRDPQRVGRVSRAREQARDPGGPPLSRAARRSLHVPGPVRAPLRHPQRDPCRAWLRRASRTRSSPCCASASARACTRSRSCRRSTVRARSSATSPNRSSPATSMGTSQRR